jgi:hypothetical protein
VRPDLVVVYSGTILVCSCCTSTLGIPALSIIPGSTSIGSGSPIGSSSTVSMSAVVIAVGTCGSISSLTFVHTLVDLGGVKNPNLNCH